MRLVIISTCDAVDRHLIGRVRHRWPDAHVLRPVWGRSGGSTPERLVRTVRSPAETSRRAYRRRREQRSEPRLQRLLPDLPSRRTIAPERIAAATLNRPPGLARLRELAPDLLLLSGAPILRADVLGVPAVGTVNVHFGIAPAYRGEHTIFHALRLGDHDHVGLTIHGVDLGVDTGPLLAHVHPALSPSDDETTVVAKAALLGAEVLVDCLEVIERTGRITGRPQPSTGQLFRRSDRRVLRHDLSEAVHRRVLGRRPPRREEQIRRYDEGAVHLLDG